MESDHFEKIRQAFRDEHEEAERESKNGQGKKPEPVKATGEQGLTRRDPVPGSLSPRVFQALAQSTEREALGMVRSLSKREAQEKLQAQLDLHRGHEALRLKFGLEDLRVQCLIENLDHAKRVTAENPEVEANIWESLNAKDEFASQVARLVPVGFLRRYYDLGQDHARTCDP